MRAVPAVVVVVAAVVAAAGCASPGEPPVAALGPPLRGPGGDVAATAAEAGAAPASPGASAEDAGATGGPEDVTPARVDICDLARDPEAMADVERWAAYIPGLEAALPDDVDVAAALGVAPDTPATPSVMTRLDQVWDLVDERCQQDPLVEQCRSLIAIALADPLGWAVRAADAAEVEAAFALAAANWSDLRQRVAGDDLRAAIDAQLTFLAAAGDELAAAGWGPGRVDALEPLADQMVALGEPDVVEPLRQLEATCGFP